MNKDECACEKLEGKMPSYSHCLQAFEEIVAVKDNSLKLVRKLKDRELKAMFVGYSDNHTENVCRFVSLKTKRIILSCNVTWMSKLHTGTSTTKNVARRYEL